MGGLVGVAGVQHGAVADGAHHGEVFQSHLRGAVLADGDARMGAAEAEARALEMEAMRIWS